MTDLLTPILPTMPVPLESPFGVGEPFEVMVTRDVKTPAGNVIAPAGLVTVAFTYPPGEFGGLAGYLNLWVDGAHYAGISWASVHESDLERL